MALNSAIEIPKGPPFVTDLDGRLVVSSTAGLGAVTGTPADGFASPGAIPEHMAFPELFNGTTWDRQRANTEGMLLTLAARTALTVSALQTNYNARGVVLFLRVTAGSGTGGLSVRARMQDTSGNTYDLNTAPTVVTAVGSYGYAFYPGGLALAAGSNIVQVTSVPLGRTWDAYVSHGDATSYTYSLGFALIN